MSECSYVSPDAGERGGAGVAKQADARGLGPSGVPTDPTGPSLVRSRFFWRKFGHFCLAPHGVALQSCHACRD